MTSRWVFPTDSRIVVSSSGASVRGSITSTLTPSFSRSPAAWSARATMAWVAMTVTSRPARLTSALPIGMAYGSSGTSPLSG